MNAPLEADAVKASKEPDLVIRFAGDSGDGIQLIGGRFSESTALEGLGLATFPDFPAEIRAPVGTTYGVSAFQVRFGGGRIPTAGDVADVLVAMNPAALKVNLERLKPGGLIIVDTGAFSERNLKLAGYEASPLGTTVLDGFEVIEADITQSVIELGRSIGLSNKESVRCRNMWALGLVSWLFHRPLEPMVASLEARFEKAGLVKDGIVGALKAGHAFGETAELSGDLANTIKPSEKREAGTYRLVSGAEALSWGLVAGSLQAEVPLVLCSYPITPSSPVLHNLARMNEFGVTTFQAEDEIAAACAAIGASYGGNLGVTASSGPGLALKTEAIGLAISAELPLVIVDTQRAGPSTGLPTKTEQSDLFISVFGRNGDAPIPVLAVSSPTDCFEVAIEAVRLAVTYMTPVILLSDGYIANSSEPWKIPDMGAIETFPVRFHEDPEGFHPSLRNPETGARIWPVPGTPGLEHRVGGIEKDYNSGHISYDPANHQRMTDVRIGKIDGIAATYAPLEPDFGEVTGDVAVVGWGSTRGPISEAVRVLAAEGRSVSHIHLRHIWPLDANLGELLSGFKEVVVPEMNAGQLATLLRAELGRPIRSLSQVNGQPFSVSELCSALRDAAPTAA